jgi:hypothetical protein
MTERDPRARASVRARAIAVNSATSGEKGFFNGAPVLHNSRNDFA